MKRTYQASNNLSDDLKSKVEKELKLGYLNLEDGCFDQAKLNFDVAIGFDEKCADAFWGLMLVKFQIENEDALDQNPVKFKEVLFLPECQKALEFAEKTQKKKFESLLQRIRQINDGENY